MQLGCNSCYVKSTFNSTLVSSFRHLCLQISHFKSVCVCVCVITPHGYLSPNVPLEQSTCAQSVRPDAPKHHFLIP